VESVKKPETVAGSSEYWRKFSSTHDLNSDGKSIAFSMQIARKLSIS
jgi:hypothetical protein